MGVFVVSVLVVALAFSGCKRGESSKVSTDSGSIGPFDVVVVEVEDPLLPKDPFNTPAAGSRYVGVHLKVTNTSEQTHTIEPTRTFELVGKLGISYRVAVLIAEPQDLSFGGPTLGVISPGNSIEGLLPFQLPSSDSPDRLRLQLEGNVSEITLLPHRPDLATPTSSVIGAGG